MLYDPKYKDKTYILGKGRATELNGAIESLQYSINRSNVAILFDTNENGAGRLILHEGIGETEIGESVFAYQLSNNGTSMAFLTDYNPETEEGTLRYYSNSSGLSSVITENSTTFFAISPNGEHVVYQDIETSDVGINLHCRLYTASGQREDIAKEVIPIAVSDDGEYVYGTRAAKDNTKTNGLSLWVIGNGTETQIGNLSEKFHYQTLVFNSDCSQVFIDTNDDGLSYSESGKSPISLMLEQEQIKDFDSLRMHRNSTNIDDYWINSYFTGTKNLSFIPLNVVLDDHLNKALVYFDKDMEPKVIVNDVGDSIVREQTIYAYSSDLKTYIAVSHSEVGSWEIRELVSVSSSLKFIVTNNDSLFYSISTDRGLDILFKTRINEVNEPQMISDRCDSWVRVSRNGKADLIYYLQGDLQVEPNPDYISLHYHDLYVVEDTPDAIPLLVSKNVGRIYSDDSGVIYWALESVAESIQKSYPDYCMGDVYDLNKLYYASDGENFQYVGIEKVMYYSPGG